MKLIDIEHVEVHVRVFAELNLLQYLAHSVASDSESFPSCLQFSTDRFNV